MSASTKVTQQKQDKVSLALQEMKVELDKLDPSSKNSENSGWQERKSTSTRISLLNAAVQCLSKFGYAKTTTQLVAALSLIHISEPTRPY